MGVPHLFRHFARRCPRAVQVLDPLGQPIGNCEELLVDFNSVIHTCARAEQMLSSSNDDFEARVVAACVAHVRRLVRRIGPTKSVFLAIDGVPPRAKMQQQRARRYANDAKRGRDDKRILWDTNAVTPGTPFMDSLGRGLALAFADDATVVVSGADEPGEGEQKIFERLRREGRGQGQGLAIVYGLDADLLLMAMAHPSHARIRILREMEMQQQQQQQTTTTMMMLQLVDVPALTKHASAEIARSCGPGVASMRQEADRVADFVALCALLGNDFAPGLPSLSIRDGGVEAVVRAHGVALSSRPDLEGRSLARGGADDLGGLDLGVLSAVAEVLARDETAALEDRERRHAAAIDRNGFGRRRRGGGDRDPDEDGDDDFPKRNPPEFGWIVLGRRADSSEGWRQRYYRHLLLRRVRNVTLDEVHAIARAYAATIAWSSAYLARNECISVGWAYPHPRAPTALDLHLALLSPVEEDVRASFEAADRAHLSYRSIPELRSSDVLDASAAWQLMQVLPPRSAANLLPPSALALTRSAPYSHLYPTTYRVCTYLCERLHECPVLLPAWAPAT